MCCGVQARCCRLDSILYAILALEIQIGEDEDSFCQPSSVAVSRHACAVEAVYKSAVALLLHEKSLFTLASASSLLPLALSLAPSMLSLASAEPMP